MQQLSSEGCLGGGRGHLRGSTGQEFPAAEDAVQSCWVASCGGSVAARWGAPQVEKLIALLVGGSFQLLSLGFQLQSASEFLLFLIITLWACKDSNLFLQSFIYSFFATLGSFVCPPFAVVLC